MPDLERDLNLVLITGAGASAPFGSHRSQLPTMRDWSDALVAKLQRSSPAYLAATGLERGLDGQAFEDRLGAFLRSIQAFHGINPLLMPSTEFQPPNPLSPASAMLEHWYSSTRQHLSRIEGALHESLYEQFGAPSIDVDAAEAGYGQLLEALAVSVRHRWVYATTNYDTIGETVIEHLGGLPDWGEPHAVSNGASIRRLHVDELLEGLPRFTPVLHVHGRIGWYIRDDGYAYGCDATQHDDGFGTPIVMLPDPDKSYDTVSTISDLWRQFELSLQRAKRVFILGHSLNDRALLAALRAHVEPLDRVGVCVRADDRGNTLDEGLPVQKIVTSELHGASVVPIAFGPPPWSTSSVETWTDRMRRGGYV